MIERYSRPKMKKIWSDKNKFDKWLQVEIAVCEAWADAGRIPKSALQNIRKARVDFDRMEEILKVTHHDVTAFLNAVGETVGEDSRYIHLGLTSSDIMDTAQALQLREAVDLLLEDVNALIVVLEDRAVANKDTIMIGRTHGVHAEPITFGLKMALWAQEMKRNYARLEEAKKCISVGKISGAVGTYATVSPDIETKACASLGLDCAPISNQVIQRDRHAQFITTLAITAGSLDKFATEIRALQRTEILEAEEPFAKGQTGSSAMPHKRNPELCERVCGLSRLIRGYSITALENMALWHERDISHSSNERVILPDACLALDYIEYIHRRHERPRGVTAPVIATLLRLRQLDQAFLLQDGKQEGWRVGDLAPEQRRQDKRRDRLALILLGQQILDSRVGHPLVVEIARVRVADQLQHDLAGLIDADPIAECRLAAQVGAGAVLQDTDRRFGVCSFLAHGESP